MVYQGELDGKNLKVAIVVARFNEIVTKPLLEGTLNTLFRLGVKSENCDVAWVPGASEIPVVLKNFAAAHYDVMIAVGCVIRGETTHYELVCQQFVQGISRVSLETGIPIISGAIMAENTVQALERCGGKHGHKGEQAALAAVEMAQLVAKIGKNDFSNQWENFREKMGISE